MWKFNKARYAEDVAAALGLVAHPEGGYFIEKHRSGSTPMTTKGQSDFDVPSHLQIRNSSSNQSFIIKDESEHESYEALTLAPGRESRRPDGDIRRNCLTSIIWMPVLSHPKLPLVMNLSDHVHYYHGGCPFQYVIYNPQTDELYTEVLGSDFTKGHQLQVPVPGGFWKCGRMLNTGGQMTKTGTSDCDFTLIGEAVAPGFDFHDFSWITKTDLLSVENKHHRAILMEFLNEESDTLHGNEVRDAEKYYEHNSGTELF